MAEHPMETTLRTALWRRLGAAIDILKTPCWPAPPPEFPSQFAEFWYVTFHALVWLDLSLSDVPE
ncbi:MAG: hypothetical protein M5R40_00005 [Anaerolineae bacterium]|nr:hypothetical protein [Anaerolineae bacterium]